MTTPDRLGETREARRARLQRLIVLASLVIGAVAGAAIALGVEGDAWTGPHAWPPFLAIGVAVLSLVVLPLLMLAAMRTTDELELAHQSFAMQASGFALICGFPAWFALWKGGFLPEPTAVPIVVGYALLTTLAYLWHRFK